MIQWLVSYFTLKEIAETEFVKGWRAYKDCYGDCWLKTSRWSLFATPIVSEDVRKQLDDWYHL